MIQISVDAANAETYALNRPPGRWDRLLENLEFISNLRLEEVQLSMVVQANNFGEMPQFVELAKSNGFGLVIFSEIRNWGTFSKEEYRKRAVHLATHPLHSSLIESLRHPLLGSKNPQISLGEFLPLRRRACQE